MRGVAARCLLAVGAFLGWLVYILGIRRRVVLEGLKRAFPERDRPSLRRLARRCYEQLGRSFVEILLARRLSDEELDQLVTFEGFEQFVAARALGKGVVVAVAHFGNWELLMRACARRGVRLAVITRTLRGRLNAAMINLRREVGVAVVSDRDSAGEAVRRLRDGETLAVTVDQNMNARRGIFVDFFGTPACTTPAAAVLSLRTGAPLLAAFPVRQLDGTHRVRVQGPFSLPPGVRGHGAVEALTQEVTRAVEGIVRSHPEQWYWLHRRWKTRPAPESQ